jgi:hypothetical protein
VSAPINIRTTLERYLPPWMCAKILAGKVGWAKFWYSIALLADVGIEHNVQGLNASFPGLGTPTALPYSGRDRMIRRGIDETDESYGARQVEWLDTWRGAGNPYAIMLAVQRYCTPSVPKLRIVNESGTWYTLNADGTTEIEQTWGAVNWDWDDQSLPTRCWMILYSDAGPWEEGPTVADPALWGGAVGTAGYTVGTTATPDQVSTVRAIVDEFKSAGDRFEWIIIAFDPASFDPAAAPGAPLPDGTWRFHGDGASSRQRSRLATARYWKGTRP